MRLAIVDERFTGARRDRRGAHEVTDDVDGAIDRVCADAPPSIDGVSDPGPRSAGTPSPVPAPGAVLCDRYQLDRLVARGGSAAIYRGTDRVLGEIVGIKLLLPNGVLSSPEARSIHLGFREEAISAMRLAHPKILRVYNYERHDPWELLVMEFVVGEDLSAHRRRKPGRRLSPIETVQVGIDCLDALEHAHDMGVTHNDVKPSNILLTRAGAIKLCDFGLARMKAFATRLLVGTPAFMSPERVRGELSDHRGDLYSLAATLYALGNGRLMFGAESDALYHHVNTPMPASPHLPRLLHEALRIAAAKDPDDRYDSAGEMRDALIAVRDELADAYGPPPLRRARGTDRPDVAPPRSAPRRGRRRGAADTITDSHDIRFDDDPVVDRLPSVPAPSPTPVAARPATDGMIAIPARRLRSAHGCDVAVAAYWLDRAPVTNEEYHAFMRATGEPAPAHWIGGSPPPQKLRHPIVGVTFDQARRYAAWRGKRLPTSAEWECAARGPSAQAFPWGDAFDPARCQCPEAGAETTAPVDLFGAGAAPEGCLDMVGNAWEWTESDPGMAPPDAGYAWVFGGSYRHACGVGGGIPRTTVAVGKAYEYLGFRCAADQEEP
jgi:serine/threonine-protein kinase